MCLFLTNSELTELTGYKLPTKQVSWLINRGYYVETNSRGLPRITYSQVEEMRRVNTPMNIANHNNLQMLNHQAVQSTYLNNQQHASASEPNINNLLNRINNLNKVSVHG